MLLCAVGLGDKGLIAGEKRKIDRNKKRGESGRKIDGNKKRGKRGREREKIRDREERIRNLIRCSGAFDFGYEQLARISERVKVTIEKANKASRETTVVAVDN